MLRQRRHAVVRAAALRPARLPARTRSATRVAADPRLGASTPSSRRCSPATPAAMRRARPAAHRDGPHRAVRRACPPTEFAATCASSWPSADHPTLERPLRELRLPADAGARSTSCGAADFTVAIVTGGGTEFVRAVSLDLYGVPPEHVVGTLIEYDYGDGADAPGADAGRTDCSGAANEGPPRSCTSRPSSADAPCSPPATREATTRCWSWAAGGRRTLAWRSWSTTTTTHGSFSTPAQARARKQREPHRRGRAGPRMDSRQHGPGLGRGLSHRGSRSRPGAVTSAHPSRTRQLRQLGPDRLDGRDLPRWGRLRSPGSAADKARHPPPVGQDSEPSARPRPRRTRRRSREPLTACGSRGCVAT